MTLSPLFIRPELDWTQSPRLFGLCMGPKFETQLEPGPQPETDDIFIILGLDMAVSTQTRLITICTYSSKFPGVAEDLLRHNQSLTPADKCNDKTSSLK